MNSATPPSFSSEFRIVIAWHLKFQQLPAIIPWPATPSYQVLDTHGDCMQAWWGHKICIKIWIYISIYIHVYNFWALSRANGSVTKWMPQQSHFHKGIIIWIFVFSLEWSKNFTPSTHHSPGLTYRKHHTYPIHPRPKRGLLFAIAVALVAPSKPLLKSMAIGTIMASHFKISMVGLE